MGKSTIHHLWKNDEEALTDLQIGNKEAYTFLFKKYYPMLCAYGSRFVSLDDAEEIAQDTLFWLWEKRENIAINKSLGQYLLRTVYNKALNQIEHLKVQNNAENVFYEQMPFLLHTTDYYQLEELKKVLKKAIEALPPTYREAFVMHRFEQMSYKEIAEKLNVSPKTIDYRIQQALKQLRVDLKDYLPLLILLSLN